MKSLGILWAQYGPYHFARADSLQRQARPANVHALELADCTRDYLWKRPAASVSLITVCPNSVTENLPFHTVFQQTRRQLAALGIEVCFLPSYSPKQSLAAFLAAKSLGIRTVMMNESHAGTARSGPLGTWVKRRLVGMFDAALVGGAPQKRYFASLGLPGEKIFTGYDAVDNDYFADRAEKVRAAAEEYRAKHRLPQKYFLSLGRFVAKKNLALLLRAYRKFLDTSADKATHLVMVGSGGEESNLRSLCAELRLPVYEHGGPIITSVPVAAGVHFHGFRQIEENPVYYALADAFILPSLREEWGLVVNEAMACGIPVAVSEAAGCAEDLLEPGWPELPEAARAGLAARIEQAGLATRIRRSGFVFDPRSDDELSRILAAFQSAPEMSRAMAQAGRQIVEKFSCQKFAENALLAARAARNESVPVVTASARAT